MSPIFLTQFRSELVKNIKLPYLFRENFVAIEKYMRLIRKILQLRNHDFTLNYFYFST
jgi:hypothetical protein